MLGNRLGKGKGVSIWIELQERILARARGGGLQSQSSPCNSRKRRDIRENLPGLLGTSKGLIIPGGQVSGARAWDREALLKCHGIQRRQGNLSKWSQK